MTLWLGWLGSMVALPDPAPGVTATLERRSGEHTTLDGRRSVDFSGSGRRAFHLSWERLTDDEYARLETIHTASNGIGPWLLATDDARWNYLTPGQAASTGVTGDPTGWQVAGGETLSVAYPIVAPLPRAVRVLSWALLASPTSGRLMVAAPWICSGWPALPGVPWTFTVTARTATPTTTPLGHGVLRWLDIDTNEVSVTDGVTATVTATGWVTLRASATPPVGAVAVLPEIRLTPSTVTAATTVYVDTPRLELGIPARGWLPGRGLSVVSMTTLTDRYPWADLHDADATLLEVG